MSLTLLIFLGLHSLGIMTIHRHHKWSLINANILLSL